MYDKLGRALYTIEIQLQAQLNAIVGVLKEMLITEAFSPNIPSGVLEDTGYTNEFAHPYPSQLLTVNYYDDYLFLEKLSPTVKTLLTYDSSQENEYGNKYASAKSLLTGTRIYLLDGSGTYTTTAYYYDYRGNTIQTRASNHMAGYDMTYHAYDFTGNIIQSLIEHTASDYSAFSVTELYTYTYDHAGRLTDTKYKLDNNSEILLTSNEYDELGRLKGKERHNHTDSEQFEYNIRNWTTKIKSRDFEQNLYYNTTIYNPYAEARYNGNIVYSTWTYNGVTKAYVYDYDELNRLTEATAYQTNGYTLYAPDNQEKFDYDKQGNIIRLWRDQNYSGVDFLQMTYDGNQVKSITDAYPSQGLYSVKEYQDLANAETEFSYDANGNMIKDLDRDIVTIRYNLLNLPDTVQFKNGSQVINQYDAGGRKLKSLYHTPVTAILGPITVSVGDVFNFSSYPDYYTESDIVSYVNNKEYKLMEPRHYKYLTLGRIHNAEGYTEDNKPYYYRKDHLGNNREVWIPSYTWGSTTYAATTSQRTQYYPSGLPIEYNSGDNPGNQPYKHNGKEFIETHGYDVTDHGNRTVYHAINRYTTMDRFAEKYPWQSPYVHAGNNPVNFVDENGDFPIYAQDGTLLGTDDGGLQGHAIIMDKDNFKQGMSYESALKYNLGLEGLANQDAIERYTTSFNNLSTRPDWDGYLTLAEANDWYRDGNGEPLFVALDKIDLSNLYSKGEKYVGEHKYISLFQASNSPNDALVYGTIGLTRYPNNQVRGSYDTYDFDMHKGGGVTTWLRNRATEIGQWVAGEGTAYRVYFNGSKTLKTLWSWTK